MRKYIYSIYTVIIYGIIHCTVCTVIYIYCVCTHTHSKIYIYIYISVILILCPYIPVSIALVLLLKMRSIIFQSINMVTLFQSIASFKFF